MTQPSDTHITVAQFCEQLDRQSIVINREYQRQEGVWPAMAQSFLIETILLGLPVPKLALHLKTDRATQRTIGEIVDGQQRATAISGFLKGHIRLSQNLDLADARGQTYSSLSPELQDRFLSYPLGFDQLVNIDDAQIREIFRRINSYEVPLNPEEQRHARHQGPFKWFIHRLAKEYGESLKNVGTFTAQQLIRMRDMKLLAEICHALLYRITTTNKNSLSKLYDRKDKEFPEKDCFDVYLRHGLDYVLSLDELHNTQLTRSFSVYSLVLAVIHAKFGVTELATVGDGGCGLTDRGQAITRLSEILQSLEEGDAAAEPGALFRAFEKGTNVASRRIDSSTILLRCSGGKMNRCVSLARLVRWATCRFVEFEGVADSLVPPFDVNNRHVVRYITLEASNTWASLLRTYYLASATGARLENGDRVTGPSISRDIAKALTRSVHVISPALHARQGPWAHHQEPNWLDPIIVHRLMQAEQLSNAQGFFTALGAGTGANQHLLTFRNFVAHRGRVTALKVRNRVRSSGLMCAADPIELPFYRAPKRPISIFTTWIVEMRSIVELLPK